MSRFLTTLVLIAAVVALPTVLVDAANAQKTPAKQLQR